MVHASALKHILAGSPSRASRTSTPASVVPPSVPTSTSTTPVREAPTPTLPAPPLSPSSFESGTPSLEQPSGPVDGAAAIAEAAAAAAPGAQKRKRDEPEDGDAPTKRKDPNAPRPEDFCLQPWASALVVAEYESMEQRLHDEIVAFATWLSPTPEERAARQEVINRVTRVVVGRFRDAITVVFGSVAHDLSFPDGDIDMTIKTRYADDMEERRRSLYQLRSRLQNAGLVSRDDSLVVGRAKVPLLKFKTVPQIGAFEIDLNVMSSEDGIDAIPIVKEYLDKMPALRPLVLVVKAMLRRANLGSAASSGLNSYSVVLMAISYLQLNPGKLEATMIASPYESESLGRLLLGFLCHYADTHPYGTGVISCAQGSLLDKATLGWLDDKQPGRLSIQCVVRPDNDVSRAATKIEEVRELFREAHKTLSARSLSDSNLLGSILGLTHKAVHFRQHLKQIVDSKLVFTFAPPLQHGQDSGQSTRGGRGGAAPHAARNDSRGSSWPVPAPAPRGTPNYDARGPPNYNARGPPHYDARGPPNYDARGPSNYDNARRRPSYDAAVQHARPSDSALHHRGPGVAHGHQVPPEPYGDYEHRAPEPYMPSQPHTSRDHTYYDSRRSYDHPEPAQPAYPHAPTYGERRESYPGPPPPHPPPASGYDYHRAPAPRPYPDYPDDPRSYDAPGGRSYAQHHPHPRYEQGQNAYGDGYGAPPPGKRQRGSEYVGPYRY